MICGTDFMSKEAVGDLHLMQPKQRQSVEWGPGEVINWVHNTRRSKLEIQCQLQPCPYGENCPYMGPHAPGGA